MASEQADKMKAQMAEFGAALFGDGSEPPTLDQMRAPNMLDITTAPCPGATFTAVDAGGVPAFWVDVDGAATDRVLLYVHGGGYVIGSAAYYNQFAGHLAKASGARVLNVDYRLAPEHPHPAPVEDATAAYRWLLDQGIEPGHIAISGDSAGGGLTLATLMSLRDAGTPLPAAGVPISPWADMEATGETMVSNAANDVLVQKEGIAGMAEAFIGAGSPTDPLASPLHGDYRGIPPLYIVVGGAETLLDDARRVADKAKAAGVDLALDVFPEMQHVFPIGVGNVPESDDAVARIGAFLKAKLDI